MKIGQRVKVVRALDKYPMSSRVGQSGVIVNSGCAYDWYVLLGDRQLPFYTAELEPLGDIPEDSCFQRFMDTLLRTDTPLVMCARSLDTTGAK